MKLWEAILIGSDRRGQHFGEYYKLGKDDQCTSCALGAAAEAIGIDPVRFLLLKNEARKIGIDLSGLVDRTLKSHFPILSKQVDKCAACTGEICVYFMYGTLMGKIVHLNDCHNWSRERIALEYVKPIEEQTNDEKI